MSFITVTVAETEAGAATQALVILTSSHYRKVRVEAVPSALTAPGPAGPLSVFTFAHK